MQKKEFGRYSSDDLRALVELLPGLQSQLADFKHLANSETERVRNHLTPPFYWATFYQIPLLKLIAILATGLGLSSKIGEFLKEADPQAAILKELPNLKIDGDPDDLQYILCIQMAIQGNLRSIGFYSKSLAELTKEVEQGNDHAFFDAVLIDRTILACPPFADRMAWAEYQGDEEFFQTLAKRLRPGRPSKKMKPYAPLRFCLYLLEQENSLAKLTEMRAYELFCHELKLFPDDLDGKAPRNLKRFIQRWRAERAT